VELLSSTIFRTVNLNNLRIRGAGVYRETRLRAGWSGPRNPTGAGDFSLRWKSWAALGHIQPFI